jgi:hypothetical protein
MPVTFLSKAPPEGYPLLTSAMSAYPFSHGLKAKFTFKSKFEEAAICGAIQVGNTLYVPREAMPYAKSPNDFRVSHPPFAIDCKNEWRYDQEKLCHQSLDLLRSGKNHIFEAETGYGKTVCGSWIAAKLGQPTIIVVTKDDLVKQWREALIDVLKIPAHE